MFIELKNFSKRNEYPYVILRENYFFLANSINIKDKRKKVLVVAKFLVVFISGNSVFSFFLNLCTMTCSHTHIHNLLSPFNGALMYMFRDDYLELDNLPGTAFL